MWLQRCIHGICLAVIKEALVHFGIARYRLCEATGRGSTHPTRLCEERSDVAVHFLALWCELIGGLLRCARNDVFWVCLLVINLTNVIKA